MGHKHDADPPVEATQANVDQAMAASAAVGDLPPDTEEMKAGHALLGRGARVNQARMLTVILSNWDEVNNTYWGKVVNANPAEGPTPFKDGDYISGLRQYPYTARPNYAFQFVLCGEDESVLVNIAHANIVARQGGSAPDSVDGGNG